MLINVFYLLIGILFGITIVLVIYVLYEESTYMEKHITNRKANINNDQ